MNSRVAFAVLIATSALVAARADAAYSFQTNVAYSTVSGLNAVVTPVSGGFGDNLPSNPTVATFAYAPTASATSSQPLSLTEVLTGDAGTESVTITGTLTCLYSPGFVAASFVPTGETIVGEGYTVPMNGVGYLPTGPDGTTAALTVAVIPAAVPEPSVVIAVAGVALAQRRSRRTRANDVAYV